MSRLPVISLMMLFLQCALVSGQVSFDGQLSSIASYSPRAERPLFVATRYIPELSYETKVDSLSKLGFEVSTNLDATWNEGLSDANISPYRMWVRYKKRQLELRLGLQKIEFGSASILRPMQWFNQIDPRDPLGLTNGVYGILGRYYFLNNANIWFWGLYGNSASRGFDALATDPSIPEFGGRFQYPVPKGEVALTYHRRIVDASEFLPFPMEEGLAENRIGIDGKWDLGVGLWFEFAHLWKDKPLGIFTHQSSASIGVDYTIAMGNGLGINLEQMLISNDEEAFDFTSPANFTAISMTYPLTFFDNLSTVAFYNYETRSGTFLVNYEHQFKAVSLFVMLYYNPEGPSGFQQNDLVYSFEGPGIRLMTVYSH